MIGWQIEIANEYGVSSRSNKNVLKLDGDDIAQPVNWTVHFKQVNWMACEMYLIKKIFLMFFINSEETNDQKIGGF